METQFDIKLLEKIYSDLDNYKIIENQKSKSKQVIIAFSGNGLYFPNEENILHKKIVEEDYYEWQNILKDEISKYKKIIFIRDVRKTWYVDGINTTYNSIEKVIELLKQLTNKKDEIITIGNSAGGYAALLFGCLLNAKKIFTISGYIHLNKKIYEDPLNPHLLIASKNPEIYKWFDITNIISKYKGSIIYFYPAYSKEDEYQASKHSIHSQIICFPLHSSEHGAGAPGHLYSFYFRCSTKILNKISQEKKDAFWTRDNLIAVTQQYQLTFYTKMKIFLKKLLQ